MSTAALSQAVCAARPGSIPDEARHVAQLAIMDCAGVGLAGSREPATVAVRRFAERSCSKPVAALWGAGERVSTLDAALVNGVASHVLDFDDTTPSMRGHPTAPLVPALLALAEERGADGRRLVEAYVIGFEVECKLGRLMNLEHYERGWHTTSTLGTIGVAAGAGWLAGLDAERMTHALAIACSFASGLVRNFGSMTKSLHVGHAARSGLSAALLAEDGFTANPAVMETDSGYVEIFSGRSGSDLQGSFDDFGTPWEVVRPGIAFKLYPSCSLTDPPIDAALQLRKNHDLRPELIERIECYGNYRCPMVLTYKRPVNELQAKFSMEYALAVAFCDGRAGIDEFSDARVNRPDVQALLRRVCFEVHPELRTRESLARDFTIVRVMLKDGTTREARIGAPLASPGNPVADEVLVDKYRDCASRVLSSDDVERSLSVLARLDRATELRALYESLLGVAQSVRPREPAFLT